MKKNWKKTLAIMLALLLTCSAFADYYVSARADEPKESITGAEGPAQNTAEDEMGGQTGEDASSDNSIMPLANELPSQQESLEVSITINGVDIKDVKTIKDGDKIAIGINWFLSDEETGNGDRGNYSVTYQVDLNEIQNVKIPDLDPRDLMDTNSRIIGYVTIKDNVVTLVITNQDFLINEKRRLARGLVEGEIQSTEGEHKSGDEVRVKMGDYLDQTFIWDNGEEPSYLSVHKQAGEIVYDEHNKKWVQTYTVVINSYKGPSTITEISDQAGSGLSNPSSITVTRSNGRTTTVDSFDDLKGLELGANETITLTYTMDIVVGEHDADSIFAAKEGGSLKNTVSGKWENNKQEGDKDFSSSADLNIKPPSVTKRVISGRSNDDEQVWQIVIDLGDAAKVGKTLQDIIDNLNGKIIQDKPGEGLEAVSGPLTVDQFILQSDGTYVAEFKTKLTDEYKAMESTTVRNTVTIPTIYGDITAEGSYTTKGVDGASITKTAGTYDSANHRITWTVVLHGVSPTSTNVHVQDLTQTWNWPGHTKTWGEHKLVNNLWVNNDLVVDNGNITEKGKTILCTGQINNVEISYSDLTNIYFLDQFITDNGGKDITLTYETEVAYPNAMKNVMYYNQANLDYFTSNGDYKQASDDAIYEDSDAANKALSKTGQENNDAASITYTLTVDMDQIRFGDQGNITITDELPDGLVYVDGSAKVEERFGLTWGSYWTLEGEDSVYYSSGSGSFYREWDSNRPSDSKPMTNYAADLQTSYDNGKLTFTIADASNAFNIKKRYGEYKWSDNYTNYTLVITYEAKVKNVRDFVVQGEKQTYTNKAQGNYNGVSLGPEVQATNELTPQSVVTKNGVFVPEGDRENNLVDFTIDINPDALDLLPEGRLEAVDTLGDDLSYDLATIVVYEVKANGDKTPLTQGAGDDQYSFVYDPFSHSITFSLPDGKHLLITYTTKADVYVKDSSQRKEIHIKNDFKLSGFDAGTMKSGFQRNVTAVVDRWIGMSDIGSISIRKYWDSGSGMKAVVGSEFWVYKARPVTENGVTRLEVKWDERVHSDRQFKIEKMEDDSYSQLVIDHLEYNEYYALIEKTGGETVDGVQMAAKGNSHPYFFVIEGSDSSEVQLPENCNKFAVGGFEYYPNEELSATGVIKIVKTWSEQVTNQLSSWDDIKGSLKFEIKNEDGEVIRTCYGTSFTQVSSSDNSWESAEFKVPCGTYTVVETNSLEGYEVITEYMVTVTDTTGNRTNGPSGKTPTADNVKLVNTGDRVTVTYDNTYQYVGTYPVKISKRAATGAKEVAGAYIKLSGGSLTSPKYWTSGDLGTDSEGNVKPYEIELQPGTYTLEERIAPKGYKKAEIVTFRVEPDGTITIISGPGAEENGTVIMKDEPLILEVDKVALGGGSEVEGALLILYDGNNKELARNRSQKGGAWNIGQYLELGGKYRLVEYTAPKGYGYSEDIEFEVTEAGEFNVTKGSVGTGSTSTKFLMEDREINASLSKVDSQGNVLLEARLGLYKASDVDTDGTPKAAAKAICEWTSGSEPFRLGGVNGYLEADQEYAIVELGVPTGYEQADPVYFIVNKDGTVEVYGDVDFDATTGIIKMVDLAATETKELATLELRKTIGGALSIDDINGDLTFTVKSTNTNYNEKTFTIKARDFRKVGDAYVLRLTGLEPGTYTVTESKYGVDGMECKVTYTITASSDAAPGSAVENVTTDDIVLEAGGEVIVAYHNEYSYHMGSIKVAKSFTSSGNTLSWDDIKSDLSFRIYGDHGVDKTVAGTELTLKDGVYVSDEFPVRTGNYTVEEINTTQPNRTVTTTYTVTVNEGVPGSKQEGGKASVTLNNNGDKATVTFNNDYVIKYQVPISKKAISGTKELAGATLKVYAGEKATGNPIARWVSDTKPYDELYLEPGTYTLVEETAPKGYTKAESITFTVNGDGTVSIVGGTDGNTAVVMEDAPLKIQVSKRKISGADEVPGATLYVYRQTDVGTDGKPKAGRNQVAGPWVSKVGQPWEIGEFLEADEDYVLIETGAPDGYGYSENIKFTVKANGTIGGVDSDNLDGNCIVVRDQAISIRLNKVKLGSTQEIEGAIISVYYAKDIGDDGKKRNPETKALDTWRSKANEVHDFGPALQPDQEYVLVETMAPDGYLITTSIRFKVDRKGNVSNVKKITGESVTVRNGVYLMEDGVLDKPRATLVLTKIVEGEVNPADIIKTNLGFLVESTDLDQPYREAFYVGSDGFGWDGEKYALTIYNLDPGTYKVTEFWDDANSSGIVCIGQRWNITLPLSSGGMSAGTDIPGATTDKFKLENGYKAELEYTNTYEKGGTLVITKTIEGPVTQDELEGTLRFIVTNNDTKETNTYTLEKDFTYDSEMRTWTKELSLIAGGYTVEESVEAPDGRTCVTKYALNDGDAQNGTKVENVVLAKGGTVTVEYTNIYSNSEGILPRPQEPVDPTPDTPHNPSGGEDQGDKGNGGGNSNSSGSSNNSGSSNSASVLSETAQTATTGLTRTGDSAPIGVWLMLLVLGIAGAVGGGYAFRRKKKKDEGREGF